VKIHNEKETCARLQKKSKQQLQQTIQSLITSEDPESMEDDLELPEEEIIANRKIRNARSHKNRLHGLRIHEDHDSVG
jgi:23S rRNA maturation mini-RNase III